MGWMAYAQTPAPIKIQGLVLNEAHKPVVGATLLVTTPTDTVKVLAFGIADQQGRYRIPIGHLPEQLRLSVRAMGYHPQHIALPKAELTRDFHLEASSRMLKEVVVKAPPITQEKDTITYNLKSFADKHDRTLADVLGKLPGIDVSKTGMISYQGKSINKFYIEGRDMLEGRYNLATNNLSHEAVASVQVLERHQPVQMLKGREVSEQAAINITLKKQYTLAGKAEVGGGFPDRWLANLTGMLFAKQRQLLASVQAHNLGERMGNQLRQLTDMGNITNLQPIHILQQAPSTPPILSDAQTLFQQSALASANGLYPLKKGELKFAVDYLRSKQTQQLGQLYRYYLGKDTVTYQEGTEGRYQEHWLRGKLFYERNEPRIYLRNELQVTYRADEQLEHFLLKDGRQVRQQALTPFAGIANHLHAIFPWGKRLITSQTTLSLQRQPEQLGVLGSPFWGAMHLTDVDSAQRQLATISQGQFSQQLRTTRKLGKWDATLRAQADYQQKLLDTRFLTEEPLDGRFYNHLSSRRTQLQVASQWRRAWGNWELSAQLPATFLSLVLEEGPKSADRSRMLFNPSASLRYQHPSWDLDFSGNRRLSLADLPQVYYGLMMNDYRTLQNRDVPIQETDTQSYTGGLAYKYPVSGFFWNMGYNYSNSHTNGMLQERVGADGTRSLQLLPIDNRRWQHGINTSLSKNFLQLRFTAWLEAQASEQHYTQLIGETLTPIRGRSGNLKARFRLPASQWLTAEGHYSWLFSRSYLDGKAAPLLRQEVAEASLHIYPGKQHYIGLTNRFYRHPDLRQQFVFTDLLYRYSPTSPKIDLEIGVQNLFDYRAYTIWQMTGYAFQERSIPLRPRQGVVRVRFVL